jgi:hypothetical protein
LKVLVSISDHGTYKKKKKQTSLNDTQVFTSDVEILEAKYRNMFMVSVELPSRRKRDTSDTALAYGYEISLSNDRLSFEEKQHCCHIFESIS